MAKVSSLIAVPRKNVVSAWAPSSQELVAKLFRALGDPSRLRLLEFCSSEERTGSECVDHVSLSQGRVSAHLSCLVSCGLLSVRREGRFAFYKVTDNRVLELLDLARSLEQDHATTIAACMRVPPTPRQP